MRSVGSNARVELTKDGRAWRIGSPRDLSWITGSTPLGKTIRSAIPPVFAEYATLVNPASGPDEQAFATAVVEHLAAQSRTAWWLGFLDTGSDDIVFREAPKVSMYTNWQYVFAFAGPEQATSWRQGFGEPVLPDVIFPEDHSWLFSTLWDDTWSCVGGSPDLVRDLRGDQRVLTQTVGLDEDMTPPGHEMS